MGRLIEGVWDCQYCSSTKIRGSIRECPVCGRQRDGNVRFYMADATNYVDDATAKKISRNPDWLCSYCDALNSDDAHECYMCGASREGSEQNYFEHREEIETRRRAKANNQASDVNKNTSTEECDGGSYEQTYNENDFLSNMVTNNNDGVYERKDTANRRKINWKPIVTIGAGVLASIMLILCLIWVFTPKIQDVTVDSFSWSRRINVEEYRTVDESGWSLPSSARLQYSRQEIKSYEQVLDHYETKTRTYTEQVLDHYETYVSGYRDLGNGYFEEITSERPVYRTETRTETYQEPVYRSEPIYATKYYYEIDKWVHDYSAESSGQDKNPYWKEVDLDSKHRENGRVEFYYISVIHQDGETKDYSFDFDTWQSLNAGNKIKIKTTVFGTAELIIDNKIVGTQGR